MTITPRTVRLLDRRPGEPESPRIVEGFEIERNVPLPKPRSYSLKRVLASLQVGESIVYTASATWTRRLFKDRKFTAKKLATHRYRIWRTE